MGAEGLLLRGTAYILLLSKNLRDQVQNKRTQEFCFLSFCLKKKSLNRYTRKYTKAILILFLVGVGVKTGFLCVVPAVLELSRPGWSRTQRSTCLSFPNAGTKGKHQHCPALIFFFFFLFILCEFTCHGAHMKVGGQLSTQAFHHGGPLDGTQGFETGSLYPLSHFASPI